MVIEDVQTLKKSYDLLDEIAQIVRECRMEQLAQSAQMRRIEETLGEHSKQFIDISRRLGRLEKIASKK